jgi:hypothetical protein
MVSEIVIQYEKIGNSETVLRLSIDRRLIAENLTPEETRRLIVGILERIAVLDVGEMLKSVGRQSSRGRGFIERPRSPIALYS